MSKISAYTALAATGVAADDVLPIVDTSATATKKIAMSGLIQACLVASAKVIADENSNEWLKFVTTGSAVNEFTITNAATGTNPIIAPTGGDTNIGVALTPKGTGGVVVTGNGSALIVAGRQGATSPGFTLDASTATCVTGIKITPAAAAAGVAVVVTSSGTNESGTIDAKGTGTLSLNATATGNVIIGTNLQVGSAKSIVDANGNEIVKTAATVASAVNEFTVTNAATGTAPSIAATGGDTNISLTLTAKGTGVIQARSAITEKRTQTATTDTATLTIAQLLTKVLDATPTAAAAYTLPTAANLVAGIANCKVGDSFEFLINNKAAGAFTVTVGAGAGGTADGTLTVAQNVIRRFTIIVTNVTGAAEAYFVYGEGA